MKRSSVLARLKSDLDSHPLAAPTTRCIPRNGTISGNSLAAAHACHSGAAIKVIWKLPAGSTGSVCAVRVLFQLILILFYFFLFCLPKRLNVRISPKAKYEREPFFFSLSWSALDQCECAKRFSFSVIASPGNRLTSWAPAASVTAAAAGAAAAVHYRTRTVREFARYIYAAKDN